MSVVWDFVSLFFFFSLMMLAASAFTPKTALFFKEKTKLRGAIIWMSAVLVSSFAMNEFGPEPLLPLAANNSTIPAPKPAPAPQRPRPPAGLPYYEADVESGVAGGALNIVGTLKAPQDEAALLSVSRQIFADNNGRAYAEITIAWRLEGAPKESVLFAVSRWQDGKWTVDILRGTPRQAPAEQGTAAPEQP